VTQRHIPQDLNLHHHSCGNLRYHKTEILHIVLEHFKDDTVIQVFTTKCQ